MSSNEVCVFCGIDSCGGFGPAPSAGLMAFPGSRSSPAEPPWVAHVALIHPSSSGLFAAVGGRCVIRMTFEYPCFSPLLLTWLLLGEFCPVLPAHTFCCLHLGVHLFLSPGRR